MTGTLTIEEVERRVLRALKTLDAVADPDARFRAPPRSAWPDWIRDYHATHDPELLRSAIPKPARFQPSPEDIDDMLPVLAWIPAGLKHRIWLLRCRAHGVSFQSISDRRGYSREFWRKAYREIIDDIAREVRRRHDGEAA